jgi:uncharacterized membrane protein
MSKSPTTMSKLIALVFDDPYDADEAKAAVHRMGGEGLLTIDEVGVVVKHPDGKIRVTQDVNVVEKDAQVGHVLGLFTAAVTGTMPFIMAGTLGGSLVGKLTDNGITNAFTHQVSQALRPGTSALLLLARSDAERRGKVIDRLRQWKPRVLESDLPRELEDALNRALRGETAGV